MKLFPFADRFALKRKFVEKHVSGAVLILGATSAIARATAAAFAARGDNLYLASRDEDELRRIAADLRLRYGVEVHYGLFDAEATDTHEAFFQICRCYHAEAFRRGACIRLSGRPAGGTGFQLWAKESSTATLPVRHPS